MSYIDQITDPELIDFIGVYDLKIGQTRSITRCLPDGNYLRFLVSIQPNLFNYFKIFFVDKSCFVDKSWQYSGAYFSDSIAIARFINLESDGYANKNGEISRSKFYDITMNHSKYFKEWLIWNQI